jgi:hypothetical protein
MRKPDDVDMCRDFHSRIWLGLPITIEHAFAALREVTRLHNRILEMGAELQSLKAPKRKSKRKSASK